jgi:exopolysaccharide biosynthesis WecB/TagA/CpsF family protein
VPTPSTATAYAGEEAPDRPVAASPIPDSHRSADVLGIPFAVLSCDEAIACIREMVRGAGAHRVVLANAHTLNLAARDAAYHEILRTASLVLRDGVGIEIAARLRGRHLAYNFVGTDFVPLLLARIAAPQLRVFLFGAAAGVAAAAGETLQRVSPAITIVGTADGYGDFDQVARRVQSSGADILLVALGNPLQEQWIAANLARLDVRLAVGVGALLDVLSGRVPRAPRWIRALRCEWLYRFWLEPGRLWRRYLVGNAQFLWRVALRARSERR